jgi:hypothetical protein
MGEMGESYGLRLRGKGAEEQRGGALSFEF